jgi:hypothetical protein
MSSMIRHTSAWIPIALTVAIVVVMCLSFLHVIPQDPAGDEGIAAHLFQIWLVLEFFAVLFFAAKWLPHMPREAAQIVVLQIALALIPLSIVFSLQL